MFIKEITHNFAENSSTAHDPFRPSWGSLDEHNREKSQTCVVYQVFQLCDHFTLRGTLLRTGVEFCIFMDTGVGGKQSEVEQSITIILILKFQRTIRPSKDSPDSGRNEVYFFPNTFLK
ncbi:hypothetical protein CSKR_112683 [Clonorchis sinensis]|uniref:Uncharacterized protein n=1 Tax=Clonorchis sinensis TaxID=79923 RepID=A0A419Q1F6_CLOSI|nr:hypothetical protein CSKR_112683 [Clonorchis sinensis]